MTDVLITPAGGVLQFTASNDNVIEVSISGSVLTGIVTLSFIGSSGSLFSVSNTLSGTLHSVNDESGLPVHQVFSDGRVIFGKFGKNDFHLSGNMVGIGVQPTHRFHVSGSSTDSSLFEQTISGSIHHTAGGLSYLVGAGTVSIISSSNGQLIISGAGDGSGVGADVDWTDVGDAIYTTSSVAIGTGSTAQTQGSDVMLFVSGAKGGRDTIASGTALFGGDVVISGALAFGSSSLYVDWRVDDEVSVIDFIGSSGSLFSVSDTSTGTLASINDASGLPVHQVFSDSRVIFGKFGKNDFHLSGNMVGIGVQPTHRFHVSGSSTDSSLFEQTISGSIHHTAGGLSYLVGIGNITITSQTNGQIFISGTGDGGDTSDVDWTDAGNDLYTTSSVAIGTASIASTQGSDVFFFVSGAVDGKGTEGTSLFGGDAHVSGALTVGSGSVKVTSNDIQFTDFATRIERAGSDLSFFDANHSSGATITDFLTHGEQTGALNHAVTSITAPGFYPESNFEGTDDPDWDDDAGDGFQTGSIYLNTSWHNEAAFINLNDTIASGSWQVLSKPDIVGVPQDELRFLVCSTHIDSYPGSGSLVRNIAPGKVKSQLGTFSGDVVYSGSAWEFDGNSGIISCTTDSELDDVFTGGATVTIWSKVNSDGEADGGRVLTKGSLSPTGWDVYFNGSGGIGDFPDTIFLARRSTTLSQWHVVKSGEYVVYGTWSCVSWFWDSDDPDTAPRCWIDGVERTVVERGAAGVGTYVSDVGSPIRLGNRGGDISTFDGRIGFVSIHARLIDADEQARLYTSTRLFFKSATDVGNTLDEAYDRGSTSGAGRLITVDAGAVQFQGSLGTNALEVTGTVDVTGSLDVDGNVTLSDSSPQLFIGDSTGNPIIKLSKSGADFGQLQYAVGGTVYWQWYHGTDEELYLARVGGLTVIKVVGATGLVEFQNDVTLDSASPDLTLGDATGDPRILFNKSGSSTSDLVFQNEGVQSWAFVNDASENFYLAKVGGTKVWEFFQSSGNTQCYFNLTLATASPALTVGNAGGAPQIRINKDGASEGILYFQNENSQNWSWVNNASEDFELRKAAGENVLTFDQSTSLSTWIGDMTLANSASILTVGDASGSPKVRLNKDETGTSQLQFLKSSIQSWSIANGSTENLTIAKAGGISVVIFNQTTSEATFAADLSLTSSSPTLEVGDGTGSPVIRIDKSDAGTGRLEFHNTGSFGWTFQIDANENFRFQNAAFSDVMTFNQTTLAVSIKNNLGLDSANPILSVGDGTDSPVILIKKGAAGIGAVRWATGSVQNWVLEDGASENITLRKAGDVEVLKIYQADSLAEWAADLALTSSSPTLTVGDGTGSPILGIKRASAGNSQIIFQNVSANSWRLTHDSFDRFLISKLAGVAVLTIDQSTSLATWEESMRVSGSLEVDGDLNHDGSNVGFYGTTPIAKPAVVGTPDGGPVQTALSSLGLVTSTNSGGFTSTKSGSYTAVTGDFVKFDPSGGTFTLTAPSSPAVNDRIGLKNVTTSSLAITISGNGNDIEDAAAPGSGSLSVSMSGPGVSLIYQYDGTQWWIT